MPIKRFQVDRLAVEVHETRAALGLAAARVASEKICDLLARFGQASVIFACAASQNEFLAALRADPSIDWSRVTVFHMDEYVGLPADHPASFRRYLREHLVSRVPVGRFHELGGDAPDPEAECVRYQELLRQSPPGLVALGIGENGHLAFIDPAECDFSDSRDVRSVELDDVCRMQQVHDGAFAALDDVPRWALSLTVPVFLRTPRAVVCVPGTTKQCAVKRALEGPIQESCPASVLRQHPHASLFLDAGAAALIDGATFDA
jgi:glucosamine-6-phosphate deaminase